MAVTPLQNNLIANRTPQPQVAAPTADLTKQFTDATKAAQNYFKKINEGFLKIDKASDNTVKSVKAVDRSINVLGVTVKGTAKELIQVGTAIGVVSGSFFDLQQRVSLVTVPLKGVIDALGALSDRAKGVELAQSIGIDTSGIQKLELFRAGIFGNVEALQAFRTTSQTAGVNFTLNLTKLNTILKASKEELRNVGQEARKLSKDLGGSVSSVDIIAGQYQIASAGFVKAADSRAIAEASGKLATVGFNDFFSTADLVTKSLRAYGLEASKAGDIAAKLNAVVEVGITTIPELAAGFGETAVVANAFGISIDQLGAAIATITTQGSSTPEALTGIEALLRTLANQTPQATKALSELSLNGERVRFDIATVQAKGLGNALTDVFKAANGNVEVLRQIIPESRALQAALALAAQGGSLFAQSLEAVSQSSPQKLSDIFGEVQEDPTIKLKAITTKAEELVGSLSGTYEQFTNSAIDSVAKFVSVTEAIAGNPIVQGLANLFLGAADAVGKLTGFFGSLGGAAISVIGTLASINVFNNLFNGGLIRQGKLVGQSVFGLKNFGLALQQITGVDISKSVIQGLSAQLDDLRIKAKALQLANPRDTQAIEENAQKIREVQRAIIDVRKEASKPYVVAFKGLKEAQAEVRALEQEIQKLGQDDPRRAELLNKQRDAIGRVGEQRLEVEKEIKRQQKEGTLTAQQAESRRIGSNKAVSAVRGIGSGQSLFDSAVQTTNIAQIKQELEKERAKGTQADTTRIKNLGESLNQINKGTLGVLDSTGKLTQQYQQVTNFGQKAGIAIAKGWDFATGSFKRSRNELTGVEQALRLASRSENINNFGNAAGKLFSSTVSGIKLLGTGIKNAAIGTARFGADLLGNFINPLSAGLAIISLVTIAISDYNKGIEFQQEITEKFADAERKKTEAIVATTKAIQEQARVQELVSSGLSQKDAQDRVAKEKQESELRKIVPTVSGDRQKRLQQQLLNNDFRSANTFAKDELTKLAENRLGLGNDSGKAAAETTGRNALTGGLAASAAVAGGIAGAKFGAALGSVVPGLGTLLGATAGAVLGATISEGIRKIQGNAQIAEVKAEFLARRQNELEKQFKVAEAKTPIERERRRQKVSQNLALDDQAFDASQRQSGLDNNVIEELASSKSEFFLQLGVPLKRLQLQIKDTNDLLTQVDESFKQNQIPEGLFETEGLSQKINQLLSGQRQATTQDLASVDAEFKDRLNFLKAQQDIANRTAEVAKQEGRKDAETKAKNQSEIIAGQIERLSQFQIKLKPKLELSNTDIQNALRNGQGAIQSVLLGETRSATANIEALKKAISSTATTEDINSLPTQIQALGASLENISDINPAESIAVLQQLRDILSGKDILQLNAQQILALQNVVATTTNKIAQERIQKFETLARRFQGLASADGIAGQQGQILASQAELTVIDKRIEAQKQLVADAQGAAAKERATNDLIQLQLDKKTKTIEARIQKELLAANQLFEKEKARLDLTKADLDLKKQIFEQFGLQTEGVDTELAKNNLQQFQNEARRQRDELITRQQAGLEQARALGLANTSNPIEEKAQIEVPKSDDSKFKASIKAINDQESNLISATNAKFDSLLLAKNTEIENLKPGSFGADRFSGRGVAAQNKIKALEAEKAEIEKQRDAKIKEIQERASGARFISNTVNDFNQQTFKKQAANAIEKNRKPTDFASVFKSSVGVGKDNAATTEIQKQQQEELKRLDEQQKKREKELQFQIDFAASYNSVIKPLERQSKLLQDTLSSTAQILATTQQLNPLYVSQEALLSSIQASAATQILSAKRTLDVEKQKLDIQEKLLAKNGLLTADVKKQLDDQRAVLDAQFKQQVVQIQFEARQASIDAFAKKLQSTIEQKVKALDLQRSGLTTFADSFEEDTKDAEKARKLAGAVSINISVQQAALAEQILKTEQEKTLNQLKQNDLQLQFLDIQLKIQATQTKDKELLDAIASARGSISGLRANIGQEIQNAPARFAKEQELQRQQSVLSVSTAALDFNKKFGTPQELKAAQESFLRQNGLNLNQPLGDTSVNNAVGALKQQSEANQAEFARIQGNRQQQQQQQQIPVRLQADGSITNLPPQISVTVNASTNASPQDIGKAVKQELLTISRDFKK